MTDPYEKPPFKAMLTEEDAQGRTLWWKDGQRSEDARIGCKLMESIGHTEIDGWVKISKCCQEDTCEPQKDKDKSQRQ